MQEWEKGFSALRDAYAAWNETKGSSIELWVSLLADEIDFRSLAGGRNGVPWTKTRRRPAEVREYLAGLTSTFLMDHYTVDRYVCEGDTVVAIGSTAWRNPKSGTGFETPIVSVWRFKDGKVVSFFEYYDTAAVAEAAGP